MHCLLAARCDCVGSKRPRLGIFDRYNGQPRHMGEYGPHCPRNFFNDVRLQCAPQSSQLDQQNSIQAWRCSYINIPKGEGSGYGWDLTLDLQNGADGEPAVE